MWERCVWKGNSSLLFMLPGVSFRMFNKMLSQDLKEYNGFLNEKCFYDM